MTQDTDAQFWVRVRRGRPDECWPWTGARRKERGKGGGRYGNVWIAGRCVGTHRYAWESTNGPIPDSLFVLHSCDHPACCNPAHLFLGTHQDNMDDKTAKGRNAVVAGERNGKTAFTEAQVVEIRQRAADGVRRSVLAAEFGVHWSTVHGIVKRTRWKHLD